VRGRLHGNVITNVNLIHSLILVNVGGTSDSQLSCSEHALVSRSGRYGKIRAIWEDALLPVVDENAR